MTRPGPSRLVGVWSVTGARSVEEQSASLDSLRSRVASGFVEHQRSGLWIAASPDQLAESNGWVVAADGQLEYGTPLERWADPAVVRQPEGQYALIRANEHELQLVRSPSGGERLYWTMLGDVVLFASCLRLLLAHPQVGRDVDVDALRDVLLTGHATASTRHVLKGVHEVWPGHTAYFGQCGAVVRSHIGAQLHSPVGDAEQIAREARDHYADAMSRAVGSSRPVALALSGGIDSSAMAVALADVVGAEQIESFSYEFDDETHPVETPFAQMVAKKLGLKHRVFRISFDEFLESIPEHVWRSESAVHWPKAFLLPVARQVKAWGFDRYVTGFGIGSHMGFVDELTRIWSRAPSMVRLLSRVWSRVRFEGEDGWLRLAGLHPSLEAAHPRLFHVLVRDMESRGLVDDRRRFYPRELWPLLVKGGGGHSGAPRESWSTELSHLLMRSLVGCIDVTRSEKSTRENGVFRVSPAHWASCLPYAFFPPHPRPRWGSAERALRPGKWLLRLAYQKELPPEVIYRKKSWADAVVSPGWRKRARQLMLRALPHYPSDFDRYAPGMGAAVEAYEPMSILAGGLSLRLWLAMIERGLLDKEQPPTWRTLWQVDPQLYVQARGKPVMPFGPPPSGNQ